LDEIFDIHDIRRGLEPLAVSVESWLVALSPLALPISDGRLGGMLLGWEYVDITDDRGGETGGDEGVGGLTVLPLVCGDIVTGLDGVEPLLSWLW
jgi:hypothetical protein